MYGVLLIDSNIKKITLAFSYKLICTINLLVFIIHTLYININNIF